MVLGLGLLLVAGACSFSTANISSFKTTADKAGSKETSSFTPGDTIYGIAVISNSPGKTKVTARMVVEDVSGYPVGPIQGLETSLDVDGSNTATFNFTPPPSGWPKGKYKLEVVMLNEQGEQKDQKSASYTVS